MRGSDIEPMIPFRGRNAELIDWDRFAELIRLIEADEALDGARVPEQTGVDELLIPNRELCLPLGELSSKIPRRWPAAYGTLHESIQGTVEVEMKGGLGLFSGNVFPELHVRFDDDCQKAGAVHQGFTEGVLEHRPEHRL